MAKMIPDLPAQMIENDGERMFYLAARDLPREYTVLYSYKYKIDSPCSEPGKSRTANAGRFNGFQDIGEADFVIVHPELGYLVFEVKQGNIMYAKGEWHEFKPSQLGAHHTVPMAKDPVEQAQRAMRAILNRYKEKAHPNQFPLNIRFALCFPETKKLIGELPSFIDPNSVFLNDHLNDLDTHIRKLFPRYTRPNPEAVRLLIDKVLAPSFKAFALLEEQIQMFHSTAKRILTDEQLRILNETELDRKKIFFGAAGTGKTYLAVEKAKQLALSGKRVFLTCFNKNLAADLRQQVFPEITCFNFHDFLMKTLDDEGLKVKVPLDPQEQQTFFNITLPTMGFDYYSAAPETTKFDSILVDEGQDFRELWLLCLESMLRDDRESEFYIFADPNQDLFQVAPEHLMRLPVSKHRLSRNLRNAETISDWLTPFVPSGHLKPVLRGGIPVTYHPWKTGREEKQMIEREVGRLISQGISPSRVLILSPNRIENSSLAGCSRIGSWPIVDFRGPTRGGHGTRGGKTKNSIQKVRRTRVPSNAVRFATIRSFKGLESDLVFLIGLKAGKPTCTDTDIYVGASRARFLLKIFYDENMPPEKLAICLG